MQTLVAIQNIKLFPALYYDFTRNKCSPIPVESFMTTPTTRDATVPTTVSVHIFPNSEIFRTQFWTKPNILSLAWVSSSARGKAANVHEKQETGIYGLGTLGINCFIWAYILRGPHSRDRFTSGSSMSLIFNG